MYGPHDEKFYAYLNKLKDEYYDLQRSGYSGEGFFSNGTRLGVGTSHDLPPHIARVKALEAAEKRRKGNLLSSGPGGTRLGGNWRGVLTKTPRELALEVSLRHFENLMDEPN